MKTDYSPFLNSDAEGRIFWRLEDAVQLVAGYVPARDDLGDSARMLCCPSDGSV